MKDATPEEQPPGHPFTPGQVKALRWAVIIMGVLIIFGLIALIFGMARQASRMSAQKVDRPAAATAGPGAPYTLPLAVGDAQVVQTMIGDGVLAIHLRPRAGAEGGLPEEIVLIDIGTGRETGRVVLQRAAPEREAPPR